MTLACPALAPSCPALPSGLRLPARRLGDVRAGAVSTPLCRPRPCPAPPLPPPLLSLSATATSALAIELLLRSMWARRRRSHGRGHDAAPVRLAALSPRAAARAARSRGTNSGDAGKTGEPEGRPTPVGCGCQTNARPSRATEAGISTCCGRRGGRGGRGSAETGGRRDRAPLRSRREGAVTTPLVREVRVPVVRLSGAAAADGTSEDDPLAAAVGTACSSETRCTCVDKQQHSAQSLS